MFKTLIDRYNALAFTTQYIFGFIDRGMVYMAMCDHSILPYICTLDKASSKNGGGYSLRFCPTKAQKETLKVNSKCYMLCSEEHFETVCASNKYNKGENFEKLVTEYFGQEWEKDNLPFTMGGDLTVNDVAYQIKFQKATFCSENSLRNLAK